MFVIQSLSKVIYACIKERANLPQRREIGQTIFGTCVATVPLFLETCNKEFSNVLSGKSIILAQLLLDLKIIASHDGSSSVCKKCARKIVNCYKLFVELQKAFAVGSAVENAKESGPRTPTRERYSARHQRSPTGVTPKAKRLKESTFGATAQEPEHRPLSKRSLFSDKYSVVEDENSNLMNIPTETYFIQRSFRSRRDQVRMHCKLSNQRNV